MVNLFTLLNYNPGDPIRPVDPIVFDRIGVGFHRKPTSFIKNRSDPTGFLSDSYRSGSGPDFVGIRRTTMKSDQIWPRFHRIPSNSGPDSDRWESDKNPVGSDRNYSDPTASDLPWISWVISPGANITSLNERRI
jgi:hypothetical protein